MAKGLGIPVIYYIAPQEWHWGSEKGGRKVVEATDKIIAIFEREAAFYEGLGARAAFVGNPILDAVTVSLSRAEFYRKLGLRDDQKILAVFSGSRKQELKNLFPHLLGAAATCKAALGDSVQVVVSVSSPNYEAHVRKLVGEMAPESIIYSGSSHDLIAHSFLSLSKSGTVSLEHAVLGTPCLVAYRFSPVSYWLIQKMFAKKFETIRYISLPNILLHKAVMPEFIQYDANAESMSRKAIELFRNGAEYQKIKDGLREVREILGQGGAVKRAAKEVVDFLGEEKAR
jgi:lipid-A-disaccharide synthase